MRISASHVGNELCSLRHDFAEQILQIFYACILRIARCAGICVCGICKELQIFFFDCLENRWDSNVCGQLLIGSSGIGIGCGGYENENEGCDFQKPDFLVSSKCCYYLKEKNCDDWGKEHNSVPYLGLMASEGGRRARSLRMNGCNYFGKSTIRSAPFAIFHRQDILQLALEMDALWKEGLKEKYHEKLLKENCLSNSFKMPDSIIPEIYGTIEKKPDGTLYTTKAQRTGCSMCGFGIHMEKRPHRFDLLHESNPKEWDYLMFHMCKDKDGNDYGWAKVLEYIGVGWDPTTIGGNCKGQMSLENFID